jgi:hypothetical protein
LIALTQACSYFGDALPKEVSTLASNDEAVGIIQRIVDISGLARNFEILAAPVPNAAADTQNGIRYILYNPAFISDVAKTTRTKWAAISILAHEAGHHLNGHTLTPGGSRPQLELQADLFSGFVVQRLGGSLANASAVMEQLGSPTGSPTHPAKAERLAAIASGWKNACEKDPDCLPEAANDGDFEDGGPIESRPLEPSDSNEPPADRSRSIIHQLGQ